MISVASSLLQLSCLADVRAYLGTRLEMWTAAHCLASSPRPGPLNIPLTAHPGCGNSYNRGQRSGCVWLEQLRYLVLGVRVYLAGLGFP